MEIPISQIPKNYGSILIDRDLVEVNPYSYSPPSGKLYYMDFVYDDTFWKLEQRRKKIEKIREIINDTKDGKSIC